MSLCGRKDTAAFFRFLTISKQTDKPTKDAIVDCTIIDNATLYHLHICKSMTISSVYHYFLRINFSNKNNNEQSMARGKIQHHNQIVARDALIIIRQVPPLVYTQDSLCTYFS